MSCDNTKEQLTQQLQDLEKNRGICNIVRTSLGSNPFIQYGAGLISATQTVEQDGQTGGDIINQIEAQAQNGIGMIQEIFNGIFSLPENTLDLYFYFLMNTKLRPWLHKRIAITATIQSYLHELNIILAQDYYFRIAPSADDEYMTLLTYLEQARMSLLQIKLYYVTEYDEKGQIISQGYKIPTGGPNFILGTGNFGLNIENNFDSQVFYFTRRAFQFLELSQKFLRGLLSNTYLTNKQKELQAQLEEFLFTNNRLVANLGALIPTTLAGLVPELDLIRKTVQDPYGAAGEIIIGIGPRDTLTMLNNKIGLIKTILTDFLSFAKTFQGAVDGSIKHTLATFYNAELDQLVSDIRADGRPTTIFDFYAKAPAWYARIEMVKYSLFFFDYSKFTAEVYLLGPGVGTALADMRNAAGPDKGKELEKALVASFPEIVKSLYLGNVISGNRKTFSLQYLLQLCTESINQDYAWMGIIDSTPKPLGYDIFEDLLNSGLNDLQSSNLLGAATMPIVESINTGVFLVLPSVVNMPSEVAIQQTLGAMGNLGNYITLGETSLSFLEYLTGGFDFEQCEKLQDKNLFLDPYSENPTPEGIVEEIGDAYKELWETLSKNV